MSRITHEILVRDRGLPSERACLRSSVPQPRHATFHETAYYESALPTSISDHLMGLMESHRDALAKSVGHAWIGEEA